MPKKYERLGGIWDEGIGGVTRLERLEAAILTALGPVGQDFWLDFSIPRSRLGLDGTLSLELKAVELDARGRPIPPERLNFQRFARNYDLRPSDLDREFEAEGMIYRIVGLSLRASRYPIKCERLDDGSLCVFAPEPIARLLRKREG